MTRRCCWCSVRRAVSGAACGACRNSTIASAAEHFASSQLARARPASAPLPEIEHSFTHFDLVITPLEVRCQGTRRVNDAGSDSGGQLWYDLTQPARVGLPAPIKTLLGTLSERNES